MRAAPPPSRSNGPEVVVSKLHVETTVNGEAVEFLCDSDQTLLDVLREELNLTGS